MKVDYVNSQSLPKGFRVKQYEDSDIAAMVSDPAKLRLVTDGINKYERQKDALVRARTQLVEKIVAAGYKRPETTVKVDGKDETTFDNTEGKDIGIFWNGLISGTITNKVVTGKTPEEREPQADAFMQSLADQCGEVDEKDGPNKGKSLETPPCFVLDLSESAKRESKPKTPPKFAIEGATNIINNKAEKKWVDRFTKGYKNDAGIQLPAFSFDSFTQVAPKDATPEAAQAVRQSNITNLAFAIAINEANLRDLTKKEYA